MLRKYTFWINLFIIFSLLSGTVHSLSLFMKPVAANDAEEQLIELMATYKMDGGGGFHPSMRDLFTALSSCFTLVYFLGGFTTWYLLRKKVSAEILKGVTGIQFIIFGVGFVIMLVFTFPPPIILTGLTFLCISLSYFLNRGAS